MPYGSYMDRYYRVKLGRSKHSCHVITPDTWEEMVERHGDDLIGEENASGTLQRIHTPRHIRKEIQKLLLTMNENNILEVNQKITELQDSVLPDYRCQLKTLEQLHLDAYNNYLIPALYPEAKCKVCESPMFERVFPDLFFKLADIKSKMQTDPKGVQVRTDVQQILPDIFKTVGGQLVLDTDAVDERNRRIAFHRGQQPDPVISKRVDEFRAAFETQSVITPDECGITFTIPPLSNSLAITFKPPTVEELHRNIYPHPQKSAYDLWLEEGNVGLIADFIAEITRQAYMSHGPNYKETVKYYHSENGTTIIRKSNQGDYSVNTYPAKHKLVANLPEIKGVILKGSKPPIQIDDSEVRSHIKSFVESQYEPHLAAQVLEKLDTVAEVEKKPLMEILPPHLRRVIDALKFGKGHIESAVAMLKDIQSNKPEVEDCEEQVKAVPSLTEYEAVFEEIKRDKERRIQICTNTYGIQEQYLRFIKRCDEEFLNTATPSAFDREHFDKLYQLNRSALGQTMATMLAPHLEFQATRRWFMVDGTENNVFRVLRNSKDSYRPLVTVRFVKGFFNIEMH